jgi:hypothetical protein
VSNLSIFQREPTVIVGLITAAVAAVLVLLVAFTVPISDDQQKAIIGVIGPVFLLVAALVTRHKVTPNDKVGAFENDRGHLVAGPAALPADGAPVVVEAAPRRAHPEPVEPADGGPF